MLNKVDLTGKRFGRLVVLEQAEYHIDKKGRKTRELSAKLSTKNASDFWPPKAKKRLFSGGYGMYNCTDIFTYRVV